MKPPTPRFSWEDLEIALDRSNQARLLRSLRERGEVRTPLEALATIRSISATIDPQVGSDTARPLEDRSFA